MTPEQGADGLPEGLAREVPHGAVHAGDRLEQRLPVAARVAEREHALPDPLALENAEPADARRQLVVDEAHDLRALLAVVAVVDLADEPALGAHAGDDRAALEDGIRAAPEVPAKRDVDRDGLDAVDPHGPATEPPTARHGNLKLPLRGMAVGGSVRPCSARMTTSSSAGSAPTSRTAPPSASGSSART